ncbi:MAG: alpha/beta hydrolase [Proteobacteria bacterium]|nr:alpha/beta hydrolase [Pseudomonadota bacterium]
MPIPTTNATPERITLIAADGLALAIDSRGDARDPALVFAHGFGQTRQAWNASAATLADGGWRCLTMDARGHGDSGWRADGKYDFAQFVDDLVRAARIAPHKPILVGASMGGLLGLVAQAEHEVFRALVLVDITPRWEAAGVERILTFMRAHPQGFANVEEASAAIAQYLPHRVAAKSPERLRSLLVADTGGRLRWHWDPRLLDTIAAGSEREQMRLLDAARRIRVPVLLISGARSDVVSDDTIAEFLRCVPHAQHVRVDRAAHMIAGDDNAAFTTAVAHFITPLRDCATRHTP